MKPTHAKDRLNVLREAERAQQVVVTERADPQRNEARERTAMAEDAMDPVAITAMDPAAITEILATLNEPVVSGLSTAIAYGRKEEALIALFGRLGAEDAQALHHRLADPTADDPLTVAFGRLATERRLRLTAYLGARAAGARQRGAGVTGVRTIAG